MRELNQSPFWTSIVQRHSGTRNAHIAVAVVIAALLGCAALAFGARPQRGHSDLSIAEPGHVKMLAALAVGPYGEAVPSRPLPPAVGAQQASDTQVKLVTLSPRGFEPDEILVTQKRFVLAIDNRSQLDEVSIQFLQVTGKPAAPLSRLQQWRMPRARVNANTLFELPPGDYLLTEVNHANWVCKLTVSSK